MFQLERHNVGDLKRLWFPVGLPAGGGGVGALISSAGGASASAGVK